MDKWIDCWNMMVLKCLGDRSAGKTSFLYTYYMYYASLAVGNIKRVGALYGFCY